MEPKVYFVANLNFLYEVVITRKLTTGCNFHPVVSEVIKIFSLPLANVHT